MKPGREAGQGPCPRCTGTWGAHYLTCPLLVLPPGWQKWESTDEYAREWEQQNPVT